MRNDYTNMNSWECGPEVQAEVQDGAVMSEPTL